MNTESPYVPPESDPNELKKIVYESVQDLMIKAKQAGIPTEKFARAVTEALEYEINPAKKLEEELDALLKSNTRSERDLFKNRIDRSQSAADFCREHYGRYIDAGVLSKNKLRKLDKYLLNTLYVTPGDIVLPTKSDQIDVAVQGCNYRELTRIATASRRRE